MLYIIRAFIIGFSDGWREPRSLSTSTNIDHIGVEYQEWLDKGINIGQFARAGFGSESYSERFWPFG